MNLEQGKNAIGSIVHVSDGTQQPPARFNKKLAAWYRNNFSGRLIEAKLSWDNSYNTCRIKTQSNSYAVFNRCTDLAEVQFGEHPEAPAHETVN